MSGHTALLEQCQKWFAAEQYSKIISEIETNDCTNVIELALELARAYLMVYTPTSVEGRSKIKAVLKKLEVSNNDEILNDFMWNYTKGCAHAYLDQHNQALHCFLRAIEIQPDDPECIKHISQCFDKLTLPNFSLSFRERVKLAWQAIDTKLLTMIAEAKKGDCRFSEALEAFLDPLMHIAFERVDFHVAEGADKFSFQIVLCTDEDNFIDIAKAAYFMSQEPEHLRETVSVSVGLPPTADPDFSMLGQPVSTDSVMLWLEPSFNGKKFHLYGYCYKLEQFVATNRADVEYAIALLVKTVLGTIPYMHHISGFTLLTYPKDANPILLYELSDHLMMLGKKVTTDPDVYFKDSTIRYFAPEFSLTSHERATAIEAIGEVYRIDIEQGNTRFPPLLNEYKCNNPALMDNLEHDGITAGFIFFRIDGFAGDKNKLRGLLAADKLLEYLQISCPHAIKILGNAVGSEYCYLDFITWDMRQVFKAATEFFDSMIEIPAAYYHSFRRDIPCAIIK